MWRERLARRLKLVSGWGWRRYLLWRHPGLSLGRRVLIEGPCYIRLAPGARLVVGDGVWIRHHVEFLVDGGLLEVGAGSYIGAYSVLNCHERLTIGEHCLLAEFVTVRDVEHDYALVGLPIAFQGYRHAPTQVGSGSWLGAKATITAGVQVGSCCVVGANSVVTRDLPAHTVAAGSPARAIPGASR